MYDASDEGEIVVVGQLGHATDDFGPAFIHLALRSATSYLPLQLQSLTTDHGKVAIFTPVLERDEVRVDR